VLFNPGDLGAFATPQEIFTTDVNNHDGGTTTLSTTVLRSGGSSKSIRIGYPNDEAGTQLAVPSFTATPTLYYRWYMYLDSNFSGHFPVGLKISRSFSTPNYTATVGEPGIDGDAYASPKLWMRYADAGSGFNPTGVGGNPTDTNVWGTCTALMNLDVGAAFSGAVLFDNGLSHVRAGYWYSIEFFQQMNSADGVADGILEIRIDRETVYSSTTTKWVDSARYVVNGISGFESLWFGGNVSYADFGYTPTATPYRYEDGYYVHTQAQWLT
jgi:hypothetical protein